MMMKLGKELSQQEEAEFKKRNCHCFYCVIGGGDLRYCPKYIAQQRMKRNV